MGADLDTRDLIAAARRCLVETPLVADRMAREAGARTAVDGDRGGTALALALRGSAAIERGRLAEAFRHAATLESVGGAAEDAEVRVEVAGFRAQLAFFTGAYRDALEHASAALEAADAHGDPRVRLHARRRVCVVLGNLEGPGWPAELREMLRLSLEVGDAWDQAVCHNDLASLAKDQGHLELALERLDDADAAAAAFDGETRLLRALLGATRAEVEFARGDPAAAAATAEVAIGRLDDESANPYLLGMTVLIRVRALLAADRAHAARETAALGLRRIGDRTPHARALLLRELAGALKGAGRVEEAYEALEEAAELERVAFRQFTALQLDVERAYAVGLAARREAETLREEAERDALTGLYNRRRLERVAATLETVAIAAIDLDHFKGVNDRFGHEVGDQVLLRTGELLVAAARGSDVVARTGGEEFLVLMPDADIAAARALGERVRERLADEPWDAIEPGLTVTASVGVAAGPDGMDAVRARADERLYAAKRNGRDRVE